MKAINETWTVDVDEVGAHLALPPDSGGFEPCVRGPWGHEGQLRLAAAAPDMARVLLKIENALIEDSDICPMCFKRSGFPLVDGKPNLKTMPTLVHEPDCSFDAAIRKAGIR